MNDTLQSIGKDVSDIVQLRGRRSCLISEKWKEFLASLGYIHIYHTFEQKMTEYDTQIRDDQEDLMVEEELLNELSTSKAKEKSNQRMDWYRERLVQLNYLKQNLSNKKDQYDKNPNVSSTLKENTEALSQLYEVNLHTELSKIETAVEEKTKLYSDFRNAEGKHHQRDLEILLDAMARNDEESLKKLKEEQNQFKQNHSDTMRDLMNRKQQLQNEIKENARKKIKLSLVTSIPFVFAKGLFNIVSAVGIDFKNIMNKIRMKEKSKGQKLETKTTNSFSSDSFTDINDSDIGKFVEETVEEYYYTAEEASNEKIDANQESVVTVQKLVSEILEKSDNNPVVRKQFIDMLKSFQNMYGFTSEGIEEDIGKRK